MYRLENVYLSTRDIIYKYTCTLFYFQIEDEFGGDSKYKTVTSSPHSCLDGLLGRVLWVWKVGGSNPSRVKSKTEKLALVATCPG